MTDINARMSAWRDASQHPERTSEFLKGEFDHGGFTNAAEDGSREVLQRWNEIGAKKPRSVAADISAQLYALRAKKNKGTDPSSYYDRHLHVVNDKSVDAVKDSISPNGEIKESANETDPKEFMPAMADAAAEDAMDDFEAQGVKHMMDTKKDRAAAVTPVVKDKDKVRGAEATGRYAEYNDKFTPTNATLMDIDVDTSSYLEGLMDKGLITPEEYVRARAAFRDGRARGRQDVAGEIAENQPRDY